MERDFSYLRDKYGEMGAREKFEKICTELLYAKYASAHSVKVSNGDGGIDIFVGDISKEIDVYQCKYFIDGIGDSQKAQIKKSFQKIVDNNELSLSNWYLCIPCDLTLKQHHWWAGWKNQQEEKYSIPIEIFEGGKLLSEIKQYQLYDQHFNTVSIDGSFIYDREKQEEINKDFRHIIKYIADNDFHYTSYNIIEAIDELVYKYAADAFFLRRNTALITYLENLSRIVAENTQESVLIKNEKIRVQVRELRELICKEYHKLFA